MKILFIIICLFFAWGSDSTFARSFAELKSLEKKAKDGDKVAQFQIADIYYDGEELDKNYELAVFWYKKSAVQGYVKAQYNLAMMYEYGIGTKKDYRNAALWYQKSATNGNIKAQFNLGNMYENGIGLIKNYKRAFYWYEKSAKQGYEGSQFKLGYMYEKGIGGRPKNFENAIYWYEKSARQGYAYAQYFLGNIYLQSLKNYRQAYTWYLVNNAFNYTDVVSHILDNLEKKLDSADILQSQKDAQLIVNKIKSKSSKTK